MRHLLPSCGVTSHDFGYGWGFSSTSNASTGGAYVLRIGPFATAIELIHLDQVDRLLALLELVDFSRLKSSQY